MNNKPPRAGGTLPESGTGVMPSVASADIKRHVEAAVIWRDHLTLHLQNSLRPGGTPLEVIDAPPPGEADADAVRMSLPSITEAILGTLPSADIVLWRPDLMLCAESQADYYADVRVAETDLPRKNEFWCFYGRDIASWDLNGTHILLLQALLSGVTVGQPWAALAAFYFYHEGSMVRLDRPPLVSLVPPLVVGHTPQGVEAQRLLACLSFRAQTFVEDAPAAPHYTRPERRRLEREGGTPPTVRVVNLRRPERKAKEDSDGQPATRSEYQYQFFVSPHVRKPDPRMKEPRPIWVRPYVKGPKDKPLKPPTRNVIAVKR